MTVADKRLEEVAGGLTLRERAIVALREGYAGGQLDDKLRRVLRPDDPDCKEIVEAIHQVSVEFHHVLACMCEWLYQEETQLAWLDSLDALLARDRAARSALELAGWTVSEGTSPRASKRERAVVLPLLPKPGRGLQRTLPMILGVKAFPDDDSPRPDDLDTLREQLAFELRRALKLRWSDYLGMLAVIDELNETLGEHLVHPDVEETFEPIRKKILELYEGLCLRGERFPLPERDEAALEKFRSWIQWDKLREPQAVAAAKPKPWVSAELQQELDEIEARLAAELRAQKK